MNYRIPSYIPIESILFEDIKMKRLIKDIPNCSGIGIVFGLFYHLMKDEKQRYRYDDIDILADELKTSIPMIVSVIENYGFFSVFKDEQGKKFFSPILDKMLEPYFEKCENNRINAKIGAEKRKIEREKQKDKLKQLSLLDSSQRLLVKCSANKIEDKEKYQKLNEYLLDKQISKDRKRIIEENLAQASRNNQTVEIPI